MRTGLHIQYPLFLTVFNKTLIFLDRYSKNTQMSYFIKFHPMGVELFHEDEQT